MEVPTTSSKEQILQLSRNQENVAKFIAGTTILKEIYVPGKLVNLVIAQK
jgi:leucyl-tRNA synthetase